MGNGDNSEGRRYHIMEALGKGGFGTVYRAELQSSGGFRKPVALKVLNADVEGMREIVQRLRDEARMLGVLRHRAIVQVDGLVFLEGRWTVVMEYVEGVSVKAIIDSNGTIPPRAALSICEEVAGALDAAYAQPTRDGKALGLLHRDIKPANIQLTPLGEVKLLDFGVARANFEQREARTQATIFGSLPYMSPERFELDDRHQSDIYALSATLLECITGDQMGRANLHPTRFGAQLDVELAKVRTIIDDDDLVELIRSGMSYEWQQRPDARKFERAARSISARLDGEWLKDWAQVLIPQLVDLHKPETDELSGQLLSESPSTGVELADFPADADATDDSIDFSGPPPLPEPAAQAPPPPPPQKPKRPVHSSKADAPTNQPKFPPPRGRQTSLATWVLRFAIFLLICALIIGALIVILPFLGMGGLMLMCAPFWGDAVIETNRDSFVEMLDQVRIECPDDPARNRVEVVLERGIDDSYDGNIGLIEMSSFELAFEDAIEDGLITVGESNQLVRRYDDMVRD